MGYLTDVEIKEYYERSKLVILPIKNTLVSSGQSAGLQSAAMGTPVMTTATIGFWDYEKYEHLKNIIFVENNEFDKWINLINELYFDIEKLQSLSKNGIRLIKNSYTLDKFDVELEKLLI
jgi:glycosyltransferase involved in cell wall biosynthesis